MTGYSPISTRGDGSCAFVPRGHAGEAESSFRKKAGRIRRSRTSSERSDTCSPPHRQRGGGKRLQRSELASLLQAVYKMRARTTWSSSALGVYSNDFSRRAALREPHPTPASRLNRLSIHNI